MSAFVRTALPHEEAACLALRHEVFVEGQGVPLELEQDGLDDAAVHFVALVGDELVGTARMRLLDGAAKAERVAVRPAWRGRGIGAALMYALEGVAEGLGCPEVHLHAQAAVVPFYTSLGYVGHGERFVEAGIEHLAMSKALEPEPCPQP